eukprot:TRINITY_DN5613_c0_g1_i2.p2 TRINITY_DN5613_c0_g1~~TRINITY_DN5613_c0_g1_i2.p2  ORF type:complete len:212 (+),score=65.91 TRINITY_DN5613_c0_g1_i2:69-704(+)
MLLLIRLIIYTASSCAFFFPLRVVLAGRRHFEVFIAAAQLVTGVMYNTCRAAQEPFILEEKQWHAMNNIVGTTYGLLFLIHLMANQSEGVDMLLRYVAFSCVWIAQERDHYWDATNTALVAAAFAAVTILKWVSLGRRPPYNYSNVAKGVALLAAAAGTFFMSQFDDVDPYALMHGCANVLAAWALMYLWKIVPMDRYRNKRDHVLPGTYY